MRSVWLLPNSSHVCNGFFFLFSWLSVEDVRAVVDCDMERLSSPSLQLRFCLWMSSVWGLITCDMWLGCYVILDIYIDVIFSGANLIAILFFMLRCNGAPPVFYIFTAGTDIGNMILFLLSVLRDGDSASFFYPDSYCTYIGVFWRMYWPRAYTSWSLCTIAT